MYILGRQGSPEPNAAPLHTGSARVLFAFAIIFPLLTALMIWARFHSRLIRRANLWLDDWLVVFTLLMHIGQAIAIMTAIFLGGFGRHISDDITTANLVYDEKFAFWAQYPYAFAMATVRASICFFFLRLFPQRWLRWAVYAILALDLSWLVMVIILVTTQCIPIAKNWDKSIAHGHCINSDTVLVVIAAPGVVLDVAIWLIPIPQVWRLQINNAQKIALTLLFGLGTLDISVAIVRIITTIDIEFSDFTYSGVQSAIWSLAEPAIATIVACGMCCKPLFDTMMPKLPKVLVDSLARSWKGRSEGESSYGQLGKGIDASASLGNPGFTKATGLTTTTNTMAIGNSQRSASQDIELSTYGVSVAREVSVKSGRL